MNLKEMSTSVLMHLENDIRRELSYRKYHEGYKQGQFDASMDSVAKITPITPQQQRDTIVEQAKKDVAELIEGNPIAKVPSLFGSGRTIIHNYSIKFVVNAEKRTVVAILRGGVSEKVRAKGIAKCAPSDCFNAHIGKAIAVRRALGLDVPAEYLNAPQPTEVRVGDVVEWNTQGNHRYIINEKQPNNLYGFLNADSGMDYGILRYVNLTEKATIIDDTRGVDGE